MIPFKKITHGEKVSIARFITNLKSFENHPRLENWIDDEDAYYAVVEGRIIFRKQKGDTFLFSLPIGRGPLRYSLMQLLEDSNVLSMKCVIINVEKRFIDDIKAAMPGHFTFEENENGLFTATACKKYENSVFNNNEGMVPPPTGESLK